VSDNIETTETEETLEIIEIGPVVKKTTKKAAKPQPKEVSQTEKARAIVRARLAAAKRPPVNDYR